MCVPGYVYSLSGVQRKSKENVELQEDLCRAVVEVCDLELKEAVDSRLSTIATLDAKVGVVARGEAWSTGWWRPAVLAFEPVALSLPPSLQ